MPSGRHLSRGTKVLIVIAALSAILLGTLISQGFFEATSEPAVTGTEQVGVPAPGTAFLEPQPTDTVKTGLVATEATGAQDRMYLTVDGVRVPLELDEHSYCNIGSGGLPCMAMSSLYSTTFGGKRVTVDGNMRGDTLLARRLRVLDTNETPRATPGSVYIPWQRVHDMIVTCDTASLLQTHEGLVHVTTKDGKKYVAVEPVIDEVFKVANEATAACGNIQLGTE